MSATRVVSGVLFALLCVHVACDQEAGCTRFSFLEQLLEKVVRMEVQMESIQSHLDAVKQLPDHTSHQSSSIPSTSHVAFYATMTTERATFDAGDVVQFGNVLTNIGLDYNGSSGIFKVPKDGTYIFHAAVRSDNGAEVWAFLRVNDVTKASLNAKGHGTRHASTSNSLLLTLQQNDEVKLVNLADGAKYNGGGHSSFAGYLLF